MNALLSIGLAVALAVSAKADETKFAAISEDYAALADLVAKLDLLVLEDVRIVDLPIGEAISKLQQLGIKGRRASGVINVVVRPPDAANVGRPEQSAADDPFAGGERQEVHYPETVSLTADSISFAAAVDELCKRAGYIWSVDLPTPTMPYLLLRPNPNGRQDEPRHPDNHVELDLEGSDKAQPEAEGRSR